MLLGALRRPSLQNNMLGSLVPNANAQRKCTSSCTEGSACGMAACHTHGDLGAALLLKDAPDMGHLGMGVGVGLDFSSFVVLLAPYTI
jgi:hypothetical protein